MPAAIDHDHHGPPGAYPGHPFTHPVSSMDTDYRAELHSIANAKRFDRSRFVDDTEFADWAQNRARAALGSLTQSYARIYSRVSVKLTVNQRPALPGEEIAAAIDLLKANGYTVLKPDGTTVRREPIPAHIPHITERQEI